MKKTITLRAYIPKTQQYFDFNKVPERLKGNDIQALRAFFVRLGHFKTPVILEVDGREVEIKIL